MPLKVQEAAGARRLAPVRRSYPLTQIRGSSDVLSCWPPYYSNIRSRPLYPCGFGPYLNS